MSFPPSRAVVGRVLCAAGLLLLMSWVISPALFAASAATYYVAANGSDTNSGALGSPWLTIKKAAAALRAGDTVYVRAGTYRQDLMAAASGLANKYITYSAYPGETVTLLHNPAQDNVVVELEGRSYIIINGFIIDGNNTGGLISGYKNNGYITISNNTMRNCANTQYGILVTQGTHWHIVNNTMTFTEQNGFIATGTDAINLQSSYHLVEGNSITNAPHSTVGIAGGSNIVVRNNRLSNIYNQVVTSTGSNGVWAQKILWENNTVVGGGPESLPIDGGLAQGMQLGSQQTIVRHNVFSDAYSAGVELSCYYTDNEARDVHGDRIYNNVMYGNNGAGIAVSRYNSPAVAYDNVFKNNALRLNRYSNADSNPQQLHFIDYAGGMANFNYVIDNGMISFNDLSSAAAPANVIGGASNLGPNVVHLLSWWQTTYPANIFNNLERDPLFVDESAHNFQLRSGSPLIDAGAALTTTLSSGSGSQVAVADAKYFSDGFGVVNPDWIKIGSRNPVQIASVNYGTNTITLASSTNWAKGEPVNLYKDSSGNVVLGGSSPDIGAFEYGVQLAPPPNLRIK